MLLWTINPAGPIQAASLSQKAKHHMADGCWTVVRLILMYAALVWWNIFDFNFPFSYIYNLPAGGILYWLFWGLLLEADMLCPQASFVFKP